MWSEVFIWTFSLLSMLHLGACFYFLRHQTEIETIYVDGRDVQEDWACDLPRKTKIAVCKELLASHVFSEILQLVYNKSHEKKGHKFECERRPLWLISKKYVKTKRFRAFQQMIMCPVCSKYSKTCFIANSVEDAERETFTRRTFNNDKRNAKMSFEEMVSSRETYDFESNQYLDANDRFITSRDTEYTDATERLTTSQLSSSVELFDSEQRPNSRQRANSGQRANSRQQAIVGPLGIRQYYTDGNQSDSGNRFNSEKRFDSSQQEVIPEEGSDDAEDFQFDQLVHASHSRDIIPKDFWHKVKLGQDVDEAISDVERTEDIEPEIQADHFDNPEIPVGSSPYEGLEKHIIATEKNIESPVLSPDEVGQIVSDPIADLHRKKSDDKIPVVDQTTDIEHLVHNTHPNDTMKKSTSDPETHLQYLDHAGQYRETTGKADQQVVGEITTTETGTDVNQSREASRPSDAKEKSDSMLKFDPEQKVLTTQSARVVGSSETEQSLRSNVEEQLDADKKQDLQHSKNVSEKGASAKEDLELYANPGEELEEYYFSIDPRYTQSIFLYTWFKRGGYFTIYMHIIKLETPIRRPVTTAPRINKPFDIGKVPLHARPIEPYERDEFLDEIEKNKVPSLVQNSNRLIELTHFAGGV